MSYSTVANVQADFKTIVFNTTSLVTTATVTQMIVEADALINAYVGSRWVTPVTADADTLALMSLFSRTLVSARIKGNLEVKQATNTDGNQNVKTNAFTVADVMKSLLAIKNGEMQLSGATLLLANAAFYSNNNANSEQPVFRKGVKSW